MRTRMITLTTWQRRYQYVDNDKFVSLFYLINIIKEKLAQKVQSSLKNWNDYLHIWQNMSHMVNINFEFGRKQGGGSQKYLERVPLKMHIWHLWPPLVPLIMHPDIFNDSTKQECSRQQFLQSFKFQPAVRFSSGRFSSSSEILQHSSSLTINI